MNPSKTYSGTAMFLAAALLTCICTNAIPAVAQQQDQPEATEKAAQQPDPTSPENPDPLAIDGGSAYDDEPPLSWPERRWRWYTRHTRPHRFAGRDMRTNYGYHPPFFYNHAYGYNRFGAYPFAPFGYGYGYGYGGYGYRGPADAYIQGRYDERQFREWKKHHDRNKAAFLAATKEGVALFQKAQYREALRHFERASDINQGDPANRLFAAYCLVAIGNYTDAATRIRRAIELQPEMLNLPLDIRSEYGPKIDFQAHRKRLNDYVDANPNNADLWLLRAFYDYCSNNEAAAASDLNNALALTPNDRLLQRFHESVALFVPDRAKDE